MEKINKRWLAILLSMSIILSLLPDSFLRTFNVVADENEPQIEQSTTDVELTFQSDDSLVDKAFKFTLFQQDSNGNYVAATGTTIQVTEALTQSAVITTGVAVKLSEDEKQLTVTAGGLSIACKYMYELASTDGSYLSMVRSLDTSVSETGAQLMSLSGTKDQVGIDLEVSQNAATSGIWLDYSIYPADSKGNILSDAIVSKESVELSNAAAVLDSEIEKSSLYEYLYLDFDANNEKLEVKDLLLKPVTGVAVIASGESVSTSGDATEVTGEAIVAYEAYVGDQKVDSIVFESRMVDLYVDFVIPDELSQVALEAVLELKNQETAETVLTTEAMTLSAGSMLVGSLDKKYVKESYDAKLVIKSSENYKGNTITIDDLQISNIQSPSEVGKRTVTTAAIQVSAEEKDANNMTISAAVSGKSIDVVSKEGQYEITGDAIHVDDVIVISLAGIEAEALSNVSLRLDASTGEDFGETITLSPDLTLDPNGQTYSVSVSAVGVYEIVAVYEGDADVMDKTVRVQFTISRKSIADADSIFIPVRTEDYVLTDDALVLEDAEGTYSYIIQSGMGIEGNKVNGYYTLNIPAYVTGTATIIKICNEKNTEQKIQVVIGYANLSEAGVQVTGTAVDVKDKVYSNVDGYQATLSLDGFTMHAIPVSGSADADLTEEACQLSGDALVFEENIEETQNYSVYFVKDTVAYSYGNITLQVDTLVPELSGDAVNVDATGCKEKNVYFCDHNIEIKVSVALPDGVADLQSVITDASVNISEITEWQMSGQADTDNKITLTYDNLTDGAYKLYYQMSDKAGNQTSGEAVSLTVDNTAPEFVVTPQATSVSGASTYVYGKDSEVEFTYELVENNISGKAVLVISKDGVDVTDYILGNSSQSGVFTIPAAIDGAVETYEISMSATDVCGKEGTYTATVIRDGKNPDLTFRVADSEITTDSYSTNSKSVILTIQTADDYFSENLETVKVYVNGEEQTVTWDAASVDTKTYKADVTLALSDETFKVFEVSVVAADAFGNQTAVEKTVTLDVEVPSVDITYHAGNNVAQPSVEGSNIYGESLEAHITVNKNNFDKDKFIISVNDGAVNQPSWSIADDGNSATAIISLAAVSGEAKEFNLKVAYKNLGGESSVISEDAVIIDKKAPVISVEDITDGAMYSKDHTFKVVVEEEHSLSMGAFMLAVKDSINVSDACVDVKDITMAAVTVDGKQCVVVTLPACGVYSVNAFTYTDMSGNTGASTAAIQVTVDDEAPEAKFQLNLYKELTSSALEVTDKALSVFSRNGALNEYLATSFERNSVGYYSSFRLYDVIDNLSGIREISYYVATGTALTGEVDLTKLSWENVAITDDGVYVKEVNSDKDEKYYIYYRITDNAGNVAYYNGAGIDLDQEAPKIQPLEFGRNPVFVEKEQGKIVSFFDNNVKLYFEIQEAHADTSIDHTEVYIDSDLEVDNSLYPKYLDEQKAVIEGNYTISWVDENETDTIAVKINSTDILGHSSFYEETVVVDCKAPVIDVEYQAVSGVALDTCVSATNTFAETVVAKITVTEQYLSEASVKVNGQVEDLTWSVDGDTRVAYVTMDAVEADVADYELIVYCKDKVDNDEKFQEDIVIDKKAPVLTWEFETNDSIDKTYLANDRIVYLKFDESHPVSDAAFCATIRDAIVVTKTAADVADVNVVWDDSKNGYKITFPANATYAVNGLSYTDLCGNTGSCEGINTFMVDTVNPTAKFQLNLYATVTPSSMTVTDVALSMGLRDGHMNEYLATSFQANGQDYKSSFELYQVNDNLSGVNNVAVYVATGSPLSETTELSQLSWRIVNSDNDGSYVDEIGDMTEDAMDEKYYIYYRITDNSGNVAYYNGAGIDLDQEAPKITLDFPNGGYEALQYNGVTIKTFKAEPQFKISVDESHFDESQTVVTIAKIVGTKKQEKIVSGIWESQNGIHVLTGDVAEYFGTTETGAFSEYEISINSTDLVRRDAAYSETIYVDLENKDIHIEYSQGIADGYYTGEVVATITSKSDKIQDEAMKSIRTNLISGTKLYDENGISLVKGNYTAMARKLQSTVVVKGETDVLYTLSPYNTNTKSFVVTYSAAAIYDIDWTYDKSTEKNSFVIDKDGFTVDVDATTTGKEDSGYYSADRKITLSVQDLSFEYAHKYKELESLDEFIQVSMKAENVLNGLSVSEDALVVSNQAADVSGWTYDKEKHVYKQEITLSEDAIYTLDVPKMKNICGFPGTLNVDSNSEDDWDKFVIDRTAPELLVEYDDTNKKVDHYYSGDRTAKITVSDLSFHYAADLNNLSNINVQISGRDISGKSVSVTSGEWIHVTQSGVFVKEISYTEEAIYSFGISGTDKCNNGTEDENITYQSKAEKTEINDGESFVIDKTAPQVEVTYDDKDKVEDHYYKGNRVATIRVTDLSYIYEDDNKPVGAKKTPEERINIAVTASDTAMKTVEDAYNIKAWTYSNGIYETTVTFSEDAIYSYGVTGNDIYDRAAEVTYAAVDYASFVIDRNVPDVTVTYNDSEANKQKDYYYKDTRVATITVSDLSYVYADMQNDVVADVPTEKMSISISALDAAGNTVNDAYKIAGWEFNSETGIYQNIVTLSEDAIYAVEYTGSDELNSSINIKYVNANSQVNDYASFVVDRQAPQIKVVYDDTNKLQDYYYAGERLATIYVDDLSYVYEGQRANSITQAPTNRITVGIEAENPLVQNLTEAYSIKAWSFNNGQYSLNIEYTKDAIYSFEVSGNDIYGRTAEVTCAAVDYASFVIDREAPQVVVSYDDTNKVADHYYKGERKSTIRVSDLSYIYEEQRNGDKTPKNRINIAVTASDAAMKAVDLAFDVKDWSYNNGTYETTVTFSKDAIYSYGVTGNDIYGNAAVVDYGTAVDYASFVIDRKVPDVTVTYNDSEANKQKDHYYKDTRVATVTVSDLSYVYADMQSDSTAYVPAEKMNINISALDVAGKVVNDAYLIAGWTFNSEKGIYENIVTLSEDAIYAVEYTGSDELNSSINITYKNAKGQINDYASFVIDRQAPQVEVTYNDSETNKLQDYYYFADRVATITVTDLSYVYEQQRNDNKIPDNRMDIAITASNAAMQAVGSAYSASGWSFADGKYTNYITFSKDAIYSFAVSGNDIYARTADVSYGDVSDYASFVIDREAPQVEVAYTDTNKLQDHYYKGDRKATITVNDLSYVYEGVIAPEQRIDIVITASTAAMDVQNNAFDPSDWEYDEETGVFYKNITYSADAIYSYDMSGKDIYNRDAKISYGNISDYASFVIDREAPQITVTYDDSNKLQDHYYKGDRVATIVVDDLSYVYEQLQNNVITPVSRVAIVIGAKDAAGNPMENTYTSPEWVLENGQYKKVITFSEEAIYSFGVSGNDIYSRVAVVTHGAVDYASFVIDKTAPQINVTYTDTAKKADKYHAGNRTAVITVSDLSYIYEEQLTNSNATTSSRRINIAVTAKNEKLGDVKGTYTVSGWSKNAGKYQYTVNFNTDAIYGFELTGADIYENNAQITYNVTDHESFVIDTKAPVVNVTYEAGNKDKKYYKDARKATITISDLSLVYMDAVDHNDNTLVLNNNEYIVRNTVVKNMDTGADVTDATTYSQWTLANGQYTSTVSFDKEGSYTFNVSGKDVCGKDAAVTYEANDANNFYVDLTNPVISLTYDDNTPTREIAGIGYYNNKRVATIVVTESEAVFETPNTQENITITAKDAAGDDVPAGSYTISTWNKVAASASNGYKTSYKATITYRGDANYTFAMTYTNKAGRKAEGINTNASKTPYKFTVDLSKPTGSVTAGNLGTWTSLIENLRFGLWTSNSVNVSAAYGDTISTVYSVKYYKTPDVNVMTEAKLKALSSDSWKTYKAFTVNPDERFTVYVRIEDRAGNVLYISTDGIISDASAPNEEKIAPEITVTPQQPVNDIYNTNVSVDITVVDPIINDSYSGLRNIRYEILNMGTVTQSGELYDFAYAEGKPLQSQLLQKWIGRIEVDSELNNSNDVQIVIYAQDNASNSSNGSQAIKIDITQPNIAISYNNNAGDSSFGNRTFFKEDRVATIRVTERNFNPEDVQITLTNTDGVIPQISNWSTTAGTGNGDNTVHTATLTYAADGDYVFGIACKDMVGNDNTAVDYGTSVAPTEFTIDKTLPVIQVSYNNNDVRNGNYYKDSRTATITIREHNFETTRYNSVLTANDNGMDRVPPVMSGWTSNGDVHTATVQFIDDAHYTMNMGYTDMAGNKAETFAEHNFYVDKTLPYVTLQGIANASANNDETIGFELTCTDTNFDVFAPVLTVTDIASGTKEYQLPTPMTITNGQRYTITNLEADGIYALTCTVYDKAGNAYDKVIYLDANGNAADEMISDEETKFFNFSVNREGSVFALNGEEANRIVESYYVQEVADDIVIIETNVNDLKEYQIKVNDKPLTENKDYTVEKSGGNGKWYVKKYIISKDLFAKEGAYEIRISSTDEADNAGYSDIKGAEMNFIVDKTAPSVNVSGIESNGRYQVETQIVTLIPKDDGGKLKSLTIEVLDKDGNMLDGYPITYEDTENKNELTAYLEANNGQIQFEIPEGTDMQVKISCVDIAGNEMEVQEFTDIVVSTSGWIIFVQNTPVFIGSIVAIVAIIATGILIIILKNRKKDDEKEAKKKAKKDAKKAAKK